MPGSPALDAGIASYNTPATDQRGLLRIIGAGLDIGACEAQPLDLGPISSIVLTPAGLHLTIPPVFLLRSIGVEYSPDLSPGSWIELGNFSFSGNAMLEFTDFDPGRKANPSGNYRSILRPTEP
jgi:hypothetical protein